MKIIFMKFAQNKKKQINKGIVNEIAPNGF